jgi:hypothetical protein
MQVFTVEHGLETRVVNSQLTSNAEGMVTFQSLIYLGLIQFQRSGFNIIDIQHIFQHLLVLLEKSTVAVIAQNAKKKRPYFG